jgi:hypothetical protein
MLLYIMDMHELGVVVGFEVNCAALSDSRSRLFCKIFYDFILIYYIYL